MAESPEGFANATSDTGDPGKPMQPGTEHRGGELNPKMSVNKPTGFVAQPQVTGADEETHPWSSQTAETVNKQAQKETVDLTKSTAAYHIIDFTNDSPKPVTEVQSGKVLKERLVPVHELANSYHADDEIQIVKASGPSISKNVSKDKIIGVPSRIGTSSNPLSFRKPDAVNKGTSYDCFEMLVDSEQTHRNPEKAELERSINEQEAKVASLKAKIGNLQQGKPPTVGSLQKRSQSIVPSVTLNKAPGNANVSQAMGPPPLIWHQHNGSPSVNAASHVPSMVAARNNLMIANIIRSQPITHRTNHLAPFNPQQGQHPNPSQPMLPAPMEPNVHQDVFRHLAQNQRAKSMPQASAYTDGYRMQIDALANSKSDGMELDSGIPSQQARAGHPTLPPMDEHDCGDDSDDEPLMTRTKRHPSVLSGRDVSGHPKQDKDSGAQGVPSISKFRKIAPAPEKPTTEQATADKAPPDESSSEDGSIDFSIPKFEALFQAAKTKNDPAVARVTIPGVSRENIFLSPDHEQQEMRLFIDIFLPNHEKLKKPDPTPAQAILNFHTIAVMVIEAYHQFEIGDEFGTGRGHWHENHDEGDEEYERIRDAKDADPDEIFFEVIDRWRTGLEVKKETYGLIRGAQEFCDVALDIIYYINTNGLVVEPKRATRSDKGVKRGPKAATEQKGTKRAAEVNELQSRKKPKTEPKAKSTPKKKAEPALTVIQSKKK